MLGTYAVPVRPIGWARRIVYAFIGLLAGNAAIVGYSLITSLWAPVRLHPFPSQPPVTHILIGYVGLILLYGPFLFLGWLVVGLPTVLLLPVRILNRLPWFAIPLIAAGMGLAAFLPIYLLFIGGHLTSDALPFRRSGTYWFLALLASTAGFPTYCWLIRRRSSHDL